MNARQRRRERRYLIALVGQPVLVRTTFHDPAAGRTRRAWRGAFALCASVGSWPGAPLRLLCIRGDDMHEWDYCARNVRPMP